MPNRPYDPDELDLSNPPDDLFIRGVDPVKSSQRIAQIRATDAARKQQEHAALASPKFCPYCGSPSLTDGRSESVSLEQGDWMGRYGSGREKTCTRCNKAFLIAFWG